MELAALPALCTAVLFRGLDRVPFYLPKGSHIVGVRGLPAIWQEDIEIVRPGGRGGGAHRQTLERVHQKTPDVEAVARFPFGARSFEATTAAEAPDIQLPSSGSLGSFLPTH